MVDTTVFTTPYYEKILRFKSDGNRIANLIFSRKLWLNLWYIVLLFLICSRQAFALDAATVEVSLLRVERADDGLYLSATLNFELPPAVQDALFKGVPMTFVSEVDVYRDRWYWYDKRVATATRTVRVAFQPLTRRWRISVATGTIASPVAGNALTQHFDTLSETFIAVRRIARWKIADMADIDIDRRHNIDYRFRLDVSQLPRPLQIGVVGQNEWNLSAERNTRPEIQTEPRTEPLADTK